MDASEEKILLRLKLRGPQTAAALAEHLSISAVGARQHLAALAERELVAAEDRREGVGRPKRYWRLSEGGHARFPDSHAYLSVEIIQAARAAFGEQGLEKLIRRREADSLKSYQQALAGAKTLQQKVARLAELRSREGYMAEWRRDGDGFLLLENHCPVCAAASACQGLCRSELRIFKKVLGARVERQEHLLSGARRCAYRIG